MLRCPELYTRIIASTLKKRNPYISTAAALLLFTLAASSIKNEGDENKGGSAEESQEAQEPLLGRNRNPRLCVEKERPLRRTPRLLAVGIQVGFSRGDCDQQSTCPFWKGQSPKALNSFGQAGYPERKFTKNRMWKYFKEDNVDEYTAREAQLTFNAFANILADCFYWTRERQQGQTPPVKTEEGSEEVIIV
ncbi:hypothetical protein P171DRAFT_485355 [Karstenula rhodostoma CBS 690.94]|uniref:Uncharacterized protein n=1 Tax=Karstenula rhodostoma CBS 690.94 TaxID=1392251 RepID=A0A9P4UCL7_9PLEO|nr:hypothetical protein P171DRAFT_485355 [Karstenula rhodostoma CBS 690.94]